jgi:hypothetical protein
LFAEVSNRSHAGKAVANLNTLNYNYNLSKFSATYRQSVAKAKFKFESRYVIKSKGTGAYAVDIETVEKKRIYQAILTIDKSIRKSVEEAELSADDAARLLSQYYTIAYEIFPLETVLLENRLKTYKKDVSKLTLELTNFYFSAKKSQSGNN